MDTVTTIPILADGCLGIHIKEEGGIDLYRFVRNNPINLTDKLGLFSTPDFIDHYEHGGGTPIDLGNVGLLNKFKWSSSVREGVRFIESEINKLARVDSRSRCNTANSYKINFNIRNTFRTQTNVTTEFLLFSVGRSTFYCNANCKVVADCCRRTYKTNCRNRYYINDWFKDPLDIGIELPGTRPYQINASWIESLKSNGRF